MKIDYTGKKPRYFDMNGKEIHAGDYVYLNSKSNRPEKVYLTEDGYLGTDSTNPIWIENGRAYPCEFGIYPFSEHDEPILIEK